MSDDGWDDEDWDDSEGWDDEDSWEHVDEPVQDMRQTDFDEPIDQGEWDPEDDIPEEFDQPPRVADGDISHDHAPFDQSQYGEESGQAAEEEEEEKVDEKEPDEEEEPDAGDESSDLDPPPGDRLLDLVRGITAKLKDPDGYGSTDEEVDEPTTARSGEPRYSRSSVESGGEDPSATYGDGWDAEDDDWEADEEDENSPYEQHERAVRELLDRVENVLDEFHESGEAEVEYSFHDDSHEAFLAKQRHELEKNYDKYWENVREMSYAGEIVYERRMAIQVCLLERYEQEVLRVQEKKEELAATCDRGDISDHEYVDRHRALGFGLQRFRTRVEMGSMGLTYDDIGEVADQASHILEDAVSPDNGEARQGISRIMRSLSREDAIEVLNRAVVDGVITEEQAARLRFDYVRPR